MRVIVLGASTPLGVEVVEDLTFRGHQPTAVLTPEQEWRVPGGHPVTVAYGDITNPHWLGDAVAGAEAVIDLLSMAHTRHAALQAQVATGHLLEAMAAHQVHRYVGIAPHYLSPAADEHPRWEASMRTIREELCPRGTAQTRHRLAMITDSPLAWTIVRTPALSPGPARGVRQVHLGPGRCPAASLTQTDAARFLAAQVLETSLLWTSPFIST